MHVTTGSWHQLRLLTVVTYPQLNVIEPITNIPVGPVKRVTGGPSVILNSLGVGWGGAL